MLLMMIMCIDLLAYLYLCRAILTIVLNRWLILIPRQILISIQLLLNICISLFILIIMILIQLTFVHHKLFKLLNIGASRGGVHFSTIRIRIVHASLLSVYKGWNIAVS